MSLVAVGGAACAPQRVSLPAATSTRTPPAATQTAVAGTGTALASTQTAVAATQFVKIGPVLTSIARTQTAVTATQTAMIVPTRNAPAVPLTPLALLPTPLTMAAASPKITRALPDTGFAPGVQTLLSAQPAPPAYQSLQDLWLEIPRLGVRSPIVGVQPTADGWDVSRLSSQVGWLEGTDYPTWEGNSVLTAHRYTADGSAGPFVELDLLSYGDQFLIHAAGQAYVYEVRSTTTVSPDAIASTLADEDLPWITLVTCKQYDPTTRAYKFRTVVKAELVPVK